GELRRQVPRRVSAARRRSGLPVRRRIAAAQRPCAGGDAHALAGRDGAGSEPPRGSDPSRMSANPNGSGQTPGGVRPTVKLTIDGIAVEVPKGTGLVEAALAAGIEIPVFCYE